MGDASRVLDIMRNQIIVENRENLFSGHDFIEKYCAECEGPYVRWLHSYTGRGSAIRIVHSQIGRFISKHQSELRIEKVGRFNSKCFHGTMDRPMWWRFIDL